MNLIKKSKKSLLMCLMAAVLMTFTLVPFVNPMQASAATAKYKVTCNYIHLVYNNHVGNQWNCRVSVKGKTIHSGGSCTVSSTGGITIVSKVTENDSYPDSNHTSKYVKLSVGKTLKYTNTVVVTENRGRYSGETAKWKFSYTVKRIQ